MSVMLAQNLRVINSTFSNTAGTLPAAGLDSAHQPFSCRHDKSAGGLVRKQIKADWIYERVPATS